MAIKQKNRLVTDYVSVPMRRLELPRASAHYTLNVACLPISPHGLWVEFLGFLWCPGQESNLNDAFVTTPSK